MRHEHDHEVHEHDPETIKYIMQKVKEMPVFEKNEGEKRVILATADDRGMESIYDPFLNHSNFLAVLDFSGDEVKSVRFVRNEISNLRGGVGIGIAKWIVDNRADAIVAGRIGYHVQEAMDKMKIKIIECYNPLQLKDLVKIIKKML
ncbi:NifB/NifX family molybdenum-iron cluster-binding protein [Fervidicoccus fontis]|jgi:predicted Fe-Mo cluster-binding NifX family protein|uniref:NifB/NifX family molybdenum-iron cluster-binding protein n=1 Tax=Fervidicoccus fontis TaxID=683846 RepID=A0A843AB01_9CREN|nr:NifB/NifX family molybdenum-iron cluster-binding protein [Fervidicoccus fontis]MBE9391214.1 NifB/NifX family molybdenum-iron cluster-binding protein [Fervidicoccus fontis]